MTAKVLPTNFPFDEIAFTCTHVDKTRKNCKNQYNKFGEPAFGESRKNLEHLMSYETALATCEKFDYLTHIGYVPRSNLFILDFDLSEQDIVDKSKKYKYVMNLVDVLSEYTYVERSASGRGYHVFFIKKDGKLPIEGKKTFAGFEYFGKCKNHLILTFDKIDNCKSEVGEAPDFIISELKKLLDKSFETSNGAGKFAKDISPMSKKIKEAFGITDPNDNRILDILSQWYLQAYQSKTDLQTRSCFMGGKVSFVQNSGKWKAWRTGITGDAVTAIGYWLGAYDKDTFEIDYSQVYEYLEQTFQLKFS
ncbi:MAG: hypothetical protein PHI91_02950 [Candidatus Pacebacteria bacterium]|nr:hypothetical protein [Candidatus Paceibacterota bacterium]MDD2757572.1 hypothetical protein [Candidatus Paceibacterota bacterium]MDD3970122.1 hypothetical protein [Candidatus Paceibacterota bacterium]